MSSYTLHHSLLAPAVLHILRAAGFHSTRPSVLDTLTDLCARYIILLASRVGESSYNRALVLRRDDAIALAPLADEFSTSTEDGDALNSLSSLDHDSPSIGDLRQALNSVAFFASGLTATEESWQEILRKPLATIPSAGRDKERNRRNLEDTKDVREFIDWIGGPVNKEIRRVACMLPDEPVAASVAVASVPGGALGFGDVVNAEKLDYLTTLKKKHSKTADETRFSGTALGRTSEDRGPLKIEGGPSLAEVRQKRQFLDGKDGVAEHSTKRVAT